jgi:hypothetical protein
MKKMRNQFMGIDRGSVVLFSDFEDGGEMWTGDGPRSATSSITFSDRFRNQPVVHVSLSMWDTDRVRNQRADIAAENVTANGFDLVFRTWGDSRIARVRADWLAMGELADDDDWDVEP